MEYREDQDIRINNIQSRAFIIKGNKILVMFRRKNGEEYYVFPGGHMQQGEKPEQTALREVEEETTIKCKNLKPAYEVNDYISGKEKKEYYFIGEWFSGTPTLSGEESRRTSSDNYYEPKWVEIQDIAKLLVYPAQAKEWILEYFKKKRIPKLNSSE